MYLSAESIYLYIILVVPALVLAIFAQITVKSRYSKYSRIKNSRNLTGAQAAMNVLNYYGVTGVKIIPIKGTLTDYFNPRNNTISLSEDIYYGTSVASVGIAGHEAGHAAQHAENYFPIKVRNAVIPVCNIGSWVGIPLALIGYFLGIQGLITIGLGLYAMITVFQLVTLPVEFNASRRSLKVIEETGMLADGEERSGAKKVLTAAAMTYVASLAVSLANLLRFIILLGGGSRRD